MIANDIPEYAVVPLQRCLESLLITRRLLTLSIDGLIAICGIPDLVQKMQKISAALRKEKSDGIDLTRAKEDATFAKNEREQGFPYLHAYTLVSVWSSLEAAIEDMLIGILVNEPEILAKDELTKTKVSLAKFERLDREERMRFLLSEVQRGQNSGLAQGADAFERVLQVFDLSGPVDKPVKDALWEMNHIRNVIVHRDSRADLRIVQGCPWLNLKVGDRVSVTHEKYMQCADGAVSYIELLGNRLETRYRSAPAAQTIPTSIPTE
jgi:hypothetical protein